MADFDPDKYLAETSVDKNEFNPDAYLAEGEKKKDVSPSKSVGGTSKSMAEAVGFEAPSTSEEKIKVPYVNQIKQSNQEVSDINVLPKNIDVSKIVSPQIGVDKMSQTPEMQERLATDELKRQQAARDWTSSFQGTNKELANNIKNKIVDVSRDWNNVRASLSQGEKTINDLDAKLNDPSVPDDEKAQLLDIRNNTYNDYKNNQDAEKQLSQQAVKLQHSKSSMLEITKAQDDLDQKLSENFGTNVLGSIIVGGESAWNSFLPTTVSGIGDIIQSVGELASATANYPVKKSIDSVIENEKDENKKQQLISLKGSLDNQASALTDYVGGAITDLGKSMAVNIDPELAEKHHVSEFVGSLAGTIASIAVPSAGLGVAEKGAKALAAGVFAAQGANTMWDEAEAAGITNKKDKALLTLAGGTIQGALTTIGINKLVDRGFTNSLVKDVMSESLSKIAAKKLTGTAILDVVNKSFKDKAGLIATHIAENALKGGAEGFAFGAASKAGDIALKESYNKIQGKDYFSDESGNALDISSLKGWESIGKDIFSSGLQMAAGGALASGVMGGTGLSNAKKSYYDKVVKLNNNPELQKKVIEQLDSQVKSGKITAEDHDAIINNMAAIVEADAKIPPIVKDKEKRMESINLIAERNRLTNENNSLSEEMSKYEPSMVVEYPKEIQKNKDKINKINSDLQLIAKGAERENIQRKNLASQKVITVDDINKLIDKQKEDLNNAATVREKNRIENNINDLTKQRDAIQKQSTTGVLPREQNEAGVAGGERVGMGQGEQGIAPTEEGKTEQAQVKIVGEKVKVENAPKGSHLNIGLLDGRTNRLMSHEEILSKLPKGVEVVSYKEVPAMEPTLSIETSRPLTDAEMIKLLDDTKQQAIPQIVEGEGILYDNKRGTKEGWGEFNPEYFVTQEGKNLTEAKAEKITPEEVKSEPLTPEEKSKYNTLQLKEAHGTLKDSEKVQLEKLKAKVNQKGLIEKTKAKINNVIAALKGVSPDLKVVTHETLEDVKKASEEAGQDAQKAANAGGFFDPNTNTIHLNLEKIHSNTLFHEGVHPILNAIHAIDPKAIDRLFNQVVEAEKRAGKEGVYSKEFASRYGEEEGRNLTPLQKMEAVTEFIADVADGKIKITESNFDKVKQIFVDMMKAVGVDLSGKIKTVGELKKLADNVAKSFETGTKISIDAKGKSGFVDSNGKPLTNEDMQYSINNDFSDPKTKVSFEYLANSETFKNLQKAGFITEDKTFDFYHNKKMFFHSPDGAFTGMIFKNGELMVEGKGGLFYPIRFHEDGYFWASTDSGASSMVKQLNAQAKLNGGKIFMALTSAPADKLLSNTTVSNGLMDLFLSKILDKKTNISKSIVKKAIFDAAHSDSAVLKNIKVRLEEGEKNKDKNEKLKQQHGKVYYDKDGAYVYKKELVGLRLSSLDLKGDLDEMVSTIRTKLAADKSTFKDRKHFAETLITKIAAKIKGTPSEQSLGEFLHIGISNLDMKNVTKKGYNLSKANISAAISHMFHEPLIRPEAELPLKKGEKAKKTSGRVYAVLELDCKPEKIRLEGKSKKEVEGLVDTYGEVMKDKDGSYVEAYVKTIDSNKHESYPKAIVPTDGKSKTKVHIMQDRELWHENVLDPKTGKRPTPERLKQIFPTSGVTSTSLTVFAKNKEANFQLPRKEKGTDLVESAGKRKEMTEDDKGNYLFFHYSDAKFNNLNPEKVGTHLATSRGESPLVKSSMLYTRPDRLEPNVPNRNGYIVKVAKDKVYDFNSDPLKLLPEAEKLFRKENGKDKAFDLNNQVAYVAKVASKEGYPVTVSDWNIKGTKALRAQTVEKLPVEKYQGVKEGTYNQIETNPKYENIKPNAKRRDIQYSKGEEDLNTIFGNAEATAKSHSIEKGLQELESSDYYKKQPKESQQELTEYFKERVGAEEKGTTIDKFNALDKIAEEFKKGNVTKEFRNQKKAIFEENPEIEHVEKYFSKITEQLKENKDFKKSSPKCP